VRNPGNDTRLRLLNHLLDRRREVRSRGATR